MIKWLKKIWQKLFGKRKVKAIKVGNRRIFAPLFCEGTPSNKTTWIYGMLSPEHRRLHRRNILDNCPAGMVPAIALLLTPDNETGYFFKPFPTLNYEGLPAWKAMLEELIKDGIAIFATLYTDDGPNPDHRHIERPEHQAAWREAHKEIGKYITGYLVSIESTERTNVGQTQHCIHVMQQCMPGAEFYGTHQQWKTGWDSTSTTPANATILFAETSWAPWNGDNAGLAKLQTETRQIVGVAGGSRVVLHEYNANNAGDTVRRSREWLYKQHELRGYG